MDSFFKVIPKEIVPKDYGGDQLTLKEMHGESGSFKILKPDHPLAFDLPLPMSNQPFAAQSFHPPSMFIILNEEIKAADRTE